MGQLLLGNLKAAAWIAGVLYAVIFIFGAFNDGLDSSIAFFREETGMFVAGPILLFGLFVMNDIKRWAFNLGTRSSDRAMDKVSAATSRLTGSSEKKYQELLENAVFSKEEAAKLRSTVSPAAKKILQDLKGGKGTDVLIPTYVYRMGLPGDFAVMERPSELLTCAKVVGDKIRFYDCERSTYEDGKKIGKRIAEIPIGAILGLRVLDLSSDRVARKIGAFVVDRLVNKFTVAAVGVKAEKTNVNAALFSISYVNHDGVVMDAEFFFPSNCRVGDMARKSLFRLSQGLDVARIGGGELSEMLNWAGLSDDMSSDAYGHVADSLQEGMYDASAVLRWVNLLQGSDQAVGTAKVAADMIAGVTLSRSLTLKVMSDEDLTEAEGETDTLTKSLPRNEARRALKDERVTVEPAVRSASAVKAPEADRKKELQKEFRSNEAIAFAPDFDTKQFFISLLITLVSGFPHLFLMQFLKFFLTLVVWVIPSYALQAALGNFEEADPIAVNAYFVYVISALIYIPSVHAFNSGSGMTGMDRDLVGYYRNWFLKLLEILMVGALGAALYILFGEQWMAALQ